MKKRYFVYLLVSLFFIPVFAFASEVDDEFVLVSEETKYYKTITPLFSSSDSQSRTYEISKAEYDAVDFENTRSNPTTYETVYKSMTSSISANGSYYRYKNVLNWKSMPSTRSYDIIGIGFLQSVKVHNDTTYFDEYYCYTVGGCYHITVNHPQIFISGAGTSFVLPSGDLNQLRQTFYFDVEKASSNTVYTQKAYADYSHATTNVTLTDSKKYSVIQSGGIYLNTSISSYYDAMSTAIATWTGTW